jgi:hypothetical protein
MPAVLAAMVGGVDGDCAWARDGARSRARSRLARMVFCSMRLCGLMTVGNSVRASTYTWEDVEVVSAGGMAELRLGSVWLHW